MDSILQQDYQDYEILLVDDGSNDGSGKICDDYMQKDKRVRVLHKKNEGLVSARLAGAQVAQGDYILNIDGDDCIGKGYLAEAARAVDESQADMIAWDYFLYDEESGKLERRGNEAEAGKYAGRELEKIVSTYFYDRAKPGINGGSLVYSIWTKAVKRGIYLRCQECVDQRITQGEDVSLVWLILNSVTSLFVCRVDKYFYRMNMESMTHVVSRENYGRQKILMDFLLDNKRVSAEKYMNQIRVFALYRIYGLLQQNACQLKCRKEFWDILSLCRELGLFVEAEKAKVTMPSVGERIKLFLIRRRMWNHIYIYFVLRNNAERIKGWKKRHHA